MAFESSPLNHDELLADVYRDDIEAAFTKIDQAAAGHTPDVVLTIPPADMHESGRTLVVASDDEKLDKAINKSLINLADNAASRTRYFVANDVAPHVFARMEPGTSELDALDASIHTVSEAVTTVAVSVALLGESRDTWTMTSVSRTHPEFTSRSVTIDRIADTVDGVGLSFEFSETRFGDEEPILSFEKTDNSSNRADGAVQNATSAADIEYAAFMANQIQQS